jgi:hypothetical protein
VSDLDWNSGLISDANSFLDRPEEAAVLAADMASVTTTDSGGYAGQRDNLFRLRVDARIVLEPRREAECASRELLLQEFAHAVDLCRRCGATEVIAHHFQADAAVTYERRQVDRYRVILESLEVLAEWEVRATILTDDRRGNPLAHTAKGGWVLFEPTTVVGVGIDEAGGKYETAAVYHRLAGGRHQLPHLGDSVRLDPDVCRSLGSARPIYHLYVGDQSGRSRGWNFSTAREGHR